MKPSDIKTHSFVDLLRNADTSKAQNAEFVMQMMNRYLILHDEMEITPKQLQWLVDLQPISKSTMKSEISRLKAMLA